jgi:hypothetical protein
MRPLPTLALLLIVAALAGCAGAQNTLAQDLAWDRWKTEARIRVGLSLGRTQR